MLLPSIENSDVKSAQMVFKQFLSNPFISKNKDNITGDVISLSFFEGSTERKVSNLKQPLQIFHQLKVTDPKTLGDMKPVCKYWNKELYIWAEDGCQMGT